MTPRSPARPPAPRPPASPRVDEQACPSAHLEEVVIRDCVLDGAQFHQVRIRGRKVSRNARPGPGLVIDGGSIEGLAGADQLRGAAVDPLHLEILGRLLAGAAGISLEVPR